MLMLIVQVKRCFMYLVTTYDPTYKLQKKICCDYYKWTLNVYKKNLFFVNKSCWPNAKLCNIYYFQETNGDPKINIIAKENNQK